MKKILLMLSIITLFILGGCFHDEATYPLVVDEVSDASYMNTTWSSNEIGEVAREIYKVEKYKVYLKSEGVSNSRPYFYTSKRFNVGDTLK
jgi:hypothetical protein